MWEEKLNRLRCDTCGRFFSEGPGTSGLFIPESALTSEECILQCKACTDILGNPVPKQSVDINCCYWVNNVL